MRRYEIADVQRRAAGIGVPSSFLQADLDIVSPSGLTVTEQTLADAEVLRVRPKFTAPSNACVRGHAKPWTSRAESSVL